VAAGRVWWWGDRNGSVLAQSQIRTTHKLAEQVREHAPRQSRWAGRGGWSGCPALPGHAGPSAPVGPSVHQEGTHVTDGLLDGLPSGSHQQIQFGRRLVRVLHAGGPGELTGAAVRSDP
jgi:hypothetical protein